MVQAEGFADLEKLIPMKPNLVYVASLTKTFTAVMMMQYAQEGRNPLDDYLLNYPFLSVGFTESAALDPDTRLAFPESTPRREPHAGITSSIAGTGTTSSTGPLRR